MRFPAGSSDIKIEVERSKREYLSRVTVRCQAFECPQRNRTAVRLAAIEVWGQMVGGSLNCGR